MVPRPKVIVSWSSGKDSAMALHEVRRFSEVEVVGILTTITSEFSRVSMHGVRESLLDQQAEALGLPCWKVPIPSPCSNEVYGREMARVLGDVRKLGVTAVVFGDLFLEDLRRYRETKLAEVGMTGLFPLWGRNTADLASEMVEVGLRATITCLDPTKLDRSFAGRSIATAFLKELPDAIDPSFAWAGPMFSRPVPIAVGEVVERDGFMFADLLPAASAG